MSATSTARTNGYCGSSTSSSLWCDCANINRTTATTGTSVGRAGLAVARPTRLVERAATPPTTRSASTGVAVIEDGAAATTGVERSGDRALPTGTSSAGTARVALDGDATGTSGTTPATRRVIRIASGRVLARTSGIAEPCGTRSRNGRSTIIVRGGTV